MEIKFNNTQLKELQRILELIEEKFGGIFQCNDNDEIFALTNCNGFETVQIQVNEIAPDESEYFIEVSDCYWDRGNEMRDYINSIHV